MVLKNATNEYETCSQTTTCSSSINQKEPAAAINKCLDFFNMSNINVSSCDRKEKVLKEISHLQMLVHNQDFTDLSKSIFQQLISNAHTAKIYFIYHQENNR